MNGLQVFPFPSLLVHHMLSVFVSLPANNGNREGSSVKVVMGG